ncbi:uncharacterized protein LOC143864280 [Tasmannia lanceolata]|uniref:uncharacterized protein LOC143864280 n=1 Tax=Tasmannia lanceolata TaxID=3420 RepID=UPI0040646F1E
MTDFSIFADMKDGLTTLARVEELVAGMQKEKDNAIKNVGDAARQWSSVAGILVATENKDCLTHFILLEGLWFVNQWLQEAQKWCDDTNDNFMEESINVLLRALAKLPVDYEQSIAHGIGVTVKHLLGHKSLKVQERARTLYDSWNLVRDKDANCLDVEKGGSFHDKDPKSADIKETTEGGLDISPSKASCDEANHVESSGSEVQHLNTRGSDVSQLEINDVKSSTPIQDVPLATSNQADANGIGGSSLCSSLVSNTAQESLPVNEEASQCLGGEGTTSKGTHGSLIARDRNVDNRLSDVSKLKDVTMETNEIETEMDMNEGSLCKHGEKEHCIVPLSGYSDNAQKSVMEPAVSCDIAAKESESCPMRTVSTGLSESSIVEPQLKSAAVDCEMPKYLSDALELKHVIQTDDCYPKASQDISNMSILGKPEHPEPLHRKEALETLRDKSSEMDMDYGVYDALEVARQVAREVEREVVGYREPICSSSSDKTSEGKMMQSNSPNSVGDKQGESMIEHSNESEFPTEQDIPNGGSSSKVKRLRISNIEIESQDGTQDVDSSELTTVAQEPAGNIKKGICDFDLNEDVYTEEIQCPFPIPTLNQQITLSAPIPVVAASKGAPGLTTTPLHFGGELGWRGSARTSAFRPTSSRRTPDGEKSYLAEASSHSSKQSQNFLKFDLNVADGDNDTVIDLVSAEQVPLSSGPSGDSSLEVSSRRAERLKLDLNRLSENEDACPFPFLDQRVEGQFHHLQNGNFCPSPTSSSSSRHHPSLKYFDLNDNPSYFDTHVSHDQRSNPDKFWSQDRSTFESFQQDDPVVSIMGSRMNVDRKDFINQTRSFLPNGQSVDSAMSTNLVRLGSGPPAPPTGYGPYGYNGLIIGPTTSLPLQLYGPSSVSYMVDSRGNAVIPQTTVPLSFSRPSFLTSVTGAPSGLNGVGFSRFGFDLNSNIPSMEGESREMGSLRQLFVEGQSSLTEEQKKSLKRKEPECGWELNMVGYKH